MVHCGAAAAPTGPPGEESRCSGTNKVSQVHHQDSQGTEGATGDPLILVRPSILPFESLASGRDEARYARGLAMPNLLQSDRPKGLSRTSQSAEVRHANGTSARIAFFPSTSWGLARHQLYRDPVAATGSFPAILAADCVGPPDSPPLLTGIGREGRSGLHCSSSYARSANVPLRR